jgi:hypothetical protein
MSKASTGVTQTALIFLGVMIGLAIVGGATGLLLQMGVAGAERPPGFTALQARTQTPPQPRLQVDPLADRQAVLGPERLAATYGWTDKARGRAHVPVEVAMRLLAARGWPEPEAHR